MKIRRFWAIPCRYFFKIAAVTATSIGLKALLGWSAYPFATSSITVGIITQIGGRPAGFAALAAFLVAGILAADTIHFLRIILFVIEGLGIIWLIGHARQTAAHSAQQQIKQRIKEDFFDAGSHRLKGYATNVQMSVELLELTLSRLSSSLESSELLSKMDRLSKGLGRDSKNMISLVCDLLKIHQLELEQEELVVERLAFPGFLRLLMDEQADSAERGKVTLSLFCPKFDLEADAKILQEILSELVLNALKYTPAGGEILFEAQPQGSEVLIAISNTSPDIAPQKLNRLFEEYYRGGRTDQNGSGLGLAIAQKQAQLLKGSLSVQSAGGWVTFTLRLPNA